MSFSTRSATSSINIDNLLDRRMRTLYKVLKGFTSSAQTDLARRATTEFFYMYDNLPYGQAARELMDEEDLLTVPMPLDLIDAYEVPIKEVCTCTCPKYKFVKELVSTEQAPEWTSTRTQLDLEFYTSRMALEEVDVEESASFGIDFASTPSMALDDYTFTPSFEIDVESILASMHKAHAASIEAEAKAQAELIVAKAKAQAESIKAEAKVQAQSIKVEARTTTTKRRQTLAPSPTGTTTTNNNNKRMSVALPAPAPVKKVVSRTTTITNKRQSLAPVQTKHKSIAAMNTATIAPVPVPVKKVTTSLKNRVSLAPMSKRERFADLGKGQYFIGGRN